MSLDSVSGKKYGLIIPSKRPTKEPIRINPAENAFAAESDEEEDAKFKQPNFDVKMETIKASLRKTTKINLEKALEEDASVFQYDEVYDEISREKDQKLLQKSLPSARKSKYVGKLLQASAVRKLEKELLTERKAQRELEAEQEKYGDKESFVTGAYKKKMAELRELVERRREEEAREEVMDVTKQDGLGGFYRYMFQQKTASRRTPSPTSTSFGTLKPQTGSSEKDITAERSSSRTQKSSPPRHRREDEVCTTPGLDNCALCGGLQT
ncbi:Coiled-coil domain-containing protein [Echinococcus granulosus]|uniref:Coiled-coil domain-containing protein n=1 Tax=Echinococcus granulosus TaxID=6210 RepID=W6U2L4_ECHGR|nr:Coiled-coil domain-containing protein [Echinococcus granulosus]EUB55355.1 Coiled-coil domain-containing protein [Echinococcus granulosus]